VCQIDKELVNVIIYILLYKSRRTLTQTLQGKLDDSPKNVQSLTAAVLSTAY